MPGIASTPDRVVRRHPRRSIPSSAARIPVRVLVLGALLLTAGGLSALAWRSWLGSDRDPALGGDPTAYARAGGILMTPAGMLPAAPFSDGPGRLDQAAALALAGGPLAAATGTGLGQPDRILGTGDRRIALWWNAVVPAGAAAAQPPAFHLRADLAGDRIVRIACLGAKLAEVATAPTR